MSVCVYVCVYVSVCVSVSLCPFEGSLFLNGVMSHSLFILCCTHPIFSWPLVFQVEGPCELTLRLAEAPCFLRLFVLCAKLPPQAVHERMLWSFAIQILSALKFLHGQGLALRCITPANVGIIGQNRWALGLLAPHHFGVFFVVVVVVVVVL